MTVWQQDLQAIYTFFAIIQKYASTFASSLFCHDLFLTAVGRRALKWHPQKSAYGDWLNIKLRPF